MLRAVVSTLALSAAGVVGIRLLDPESKLSATQALDSSVLSLRRAVAGLVAPSESTPSAHAAAGTADSTAAAAAQVAAATVPEAATMQVAVLPAAGDGDLPAPTSLTSTVSKVSSPLVLRLARSSAQVALVATAAVHVAAALYVVFLRDEILAAMAAGFEDQAIVLLEQGRAGLHVCEAGREDGPVSETERGLLARLSSMLHPVLLCTWSPYHTHLLLEQPVHERDALVAAYRLARGAHANVDRFSYPCTGDTLVLWALRLHMPRLAIALLSHGASWRTRNAVTGETLVHLAAFRVLPDVMLHLHLAGAIRFHDMHPEPGRQSRHALDADEDLAICYPPHDRSRTPLLALYAAPAHVILTSDGLRILRFLLSRGAKGDLTGAAYPGVRVMSAAQHAAMLCERKDLSQSPFDVRAAHYAFEMKQLFQQYGCYPDAASH